MTTPTERALKAIAIQPDPTDRDAITRAHYAVNREATFARDAIATLAYTVNVTRRMHDLEQAVLRLSVLLARAEELSEMAKAALQAQVDADPDMDGAVVQDNGRIKFVCPGVPSGAGDSTRRCVRSGKIISFTTDRCPDH